MQKSLFRTIQGLRVCALLSAFTVNSRHLAPTPHATAGTATLEVRVVDENEDPVAGANVTLYASWEDFDESRPSHGPTAADADGKVTFNGLDAQTYYLYAEKGNLRSYGDETETLNPGETTTLTVVVNAESSGDDYDE